MDVLLVNLLGNCCAFLQLHHFQRKAGLPVVTGDAVVRGCSKQTILCQDRNGQTHTRTCMHTHVKKKSSLQGCGDVGVLMIHLQL